MTSARWVRLEELFQAALDVPPANRNDFLANACAGDMQIQNEVRSLIEKYEASGSLLGSLTFKSEPTGNDAAQRLSRGEHLAHFAILSFLGCGGMGEVDLARDRRWSETYDRDARVLLTGASETATVQRIALTQALGTY
jgi:hypothetical protein